MHSSDSEQLSDDSGASDDPHQASAVPNSLLQLQGDYASGSDDVVPCTPEKEEEDGQLDGSDFHTPAQLSKRRCLPSVSPVQNRQVYVQDFDSDCVDRDFLFDPPSTRKRGFKRPRMPWSLVKEWPLDEYDREVAYEEIKTIMTQSLDEAGSKMFIKPNANWNVTGNCLIDLPNFCLIDCLIVRSSLIRNLGFILIGDTLRDHPATPEMGTFVPNGRRHGGSANNAKSN